MHPFWDRPCVDLSDNLCVMIMCLSANHKMMFLFYARCDEDFFICYFCDQYGELIAGVITWGYI